MAVWPGSNVALRHLTPACQYLLSKEGSQLFRHKNEACSLSTKSSTGGPTSRVVLDVGICLQEGMGGFIGGQGP